VAVWLARRRDRQPLARGLRLPSRPAAALLLAVGVALVWLGLPFGAWLPMVAVVPLVAALAMEIAARRSSSRLSIPDRTSTPQSQPRESRPTSKRSW
jgi:Flp pilus assembly protein TadB